MPSKPGKRKVGRPSPYEKINLEQVYKLAKYHLTDVQIADILGVTEQTITNWKKAHPEFFGSLKRGKAESNLTVSQSLYHRAVGYSHPEEKIFCTNGMVTKVQTIKHYPPSETAMIFWLKNRDPENWRDRQEIEHSGGMDLVVTKRIVSEKPTDQDEEAGDE